MYFWSHYKERGDGYHDGVLPKVRQPICPTAHQFDNPLIRQPISLTTHQSDNPLVRQPISPTTYKCKSIPSLINILQGIPTDHKGDSYIHVPYITARRPYMSTQRFFLRVTPVMNLPKYVLYPRFFNHPTGPENSVNDPFSPVFLSWIVSSFQNGNILKQFPNNAS